MVEKLYMRRSPAGDPPDTFGFYLELSEVFREDGEHAIGFIVITALYDNCFGLKVAHRNIIDLIYLNVRL